MTHSDNRKLDNKLILMKNEILNTEPEMKDYFSKKFQSLLEGLLNKN